MGNIWEADLGCTEKLSGWNQCLWVFWFTMDVYSEHVWDTALES